MPDSAATIAETDEWGPEGDDPDDSHGCLGDDEEAELGAVAFEG